MLAAMVLIKLGRGNAPVCLGVRCAQAESAICPPCAWGAIVPVSQSERLSEYPSRPIHAHGMQLLVAYVGHSDSSGLPSDRYLGIWGRASKAVKRATCLGSDSCGERGEGCTE